jgi:hypothetical protein
MHISRRFLRLFVPLLFAVVMATSLADAQIVQLANNQNGCAANGNPACFNYATNTPYLLTDILNGSEVLTIPNSSSTPSWFVQNNTSGAVTSLTLIFDGSLASNANLQCNFGGGESGACTVDGVANGINQIPSSDLPATITFSGLDIAAGTDFEINTASFAASGQDYGCLAGVATAPGMSGGTSSCTPTSTPEPSTVSMVVFGGLLLGTGFAFRRRLGSGR